MILFRLFHQLIEAVRQFWRDTALIAASLNYDAPIHA